MVWTWIRLVVSAGFLVAAWAVPKHHLKEPAEVKSATLLSYGCYVGALSFWVYPLRHWLAFRGYWSCCQLLDVAKPILVAVALGLIFFALINLPMELSGAPLTRRYRRAVAACAAVLIAVPVAPYVLPAFKGYYQIRNALQFLGDYAFNATALAPLAYLALIAGFFGWSWRNCDRTTAVLRSRWTLIGPLLVAPAAMALIYVPSWPNVIRMSITLPTAATLARHAHSDTQLLAAGILTFLTLAHALLFLLIWYGVCWILVKTNNDRLARAQTDATPTENPA